MDSFEVNKIIGALLGVVFVIFSVSLISDAIFAAPEPEKPGYAIEAMEGAGAASGEPKEEKIEDIKPMLASADVEKGKAIFKRCEACHTDDQSGANKVGPNLWGVVGRPIASHEGFSYSAAMKEFSEGGKKHWTYEHLNHFLHGPKDLVPGTAMGFAGLPKAEDRANVIAYLRTQADSPQPLPSPEELAKDESKEGAKPAEGGEKAGAEGAKPAEGGDAAKAPAGNAADTGKTEGAAQGTAPAAETGQQGTAPAAATGEQSGTTSGEAQPANQNAPAAESSTTESGTSGSGQRAEPDASNQDEPNKNTPTTDSDEAERKPDAGSGSAQ
jgi:cytochrome c